MLSTIPTCSDFIGFPTLLTCPSLPRLRRCLRDKSNKVTNSCARAVVRQLCLGKMRRTWTKMKKTHILLTSMHICLLYIYIYVCIMSHQSTSHYNTLHYTTLHFDPPDSGATRHKKNTVSGLFYLFTVSSSSFSRPFLFSDCPHPCFSKVSSLTSRLSSILGRNYPQMELISVTWSDTTEVSLVIPLESRCHGIVLLN